jgi:hypothetical protein
MKSVTKDLIHFRYASKTAATHIADFSGLLASCLCFIHCWALPVWLIFLPGFVQYNEMVHPVLCTIAMVSTAPLLFKKTFRMQSTIFKYALISGNTMMLIILFAHDHLFFTSEILINSIGGLCLVYVHCYNLKTRSQNEN